MSKASSRPNSSEVIVAFIPTGIRAGLPNLQSGIDFLTQRILQAGGGKASVPVYGLAWLFGLRQGLPKLISRRTYVVSEV